jgi:bifunctional UDP-N-acetylglucosamine pyrophosphorylase/glucosamine-1-phosphate N-acetyltransferase
MVIVTAQRRGESSFGRVIKDKKGLVKEVVEVKDCTREQLKIKEINVGAYLFDTAWLRKNISKLKKNPISGEYYATDLVGLAVSQGRKVLTAEVVHPAEAIGVNTIGNLKEAENV